MFVGRKISFFVTSQLLRHPFLSKFCGKMEGTFRVTPCMTKIPP